MALLGRTSCRVGGAPAPTCMHAALKQRKKRKREREIKYCPVCKKETEHEQMFKGMFRTNIEYCKECRVMRRGD